MAKSRDGLEVPIEGNNKGLSKALKKSKEQVKGFSIGAVAALTAITAAVVIGAKKTADYVVQILDMSDAMNVSVESLTRLKNSVAFFGLKLPELGKAMKDLNIRISQAAELGTGEAIDVLKILNLDAKELARLSPDKQLLKVFDALSKIDKTRRVGLIAGLLGKKGGVEFNRVVKDIEKFQDIFATAGFSKREDIERMKEFLDEQARQAAERQDVVARAAGKSFNFIDKLADIVIPEAVAVRAADLIGFRGARGSPLGDFQKEQEEEARRNNKEPN